MHNIVRVCVCTRASAVDTIWWCFKSPTFPHSSAICFAVVANNTLKLRRIVVPVFHPSAFFFFSTPYGFSASLPFSLPFPRKVGRGRSVSAPEPPHPFSPHRNADCLGCACRRGPLPDHPHTRPPPPLCHSKRLIVGLVGVGRWGEVVEG